MKLQTPAFCDLYPPRVSRVHEVYGAASWSFALGLWACQNGQTIWICKDMKDTPCGLFLHNAEFIFASDQKTQLWCFEAGLRSGAVSLVISVHSKTIGFTSMRRLQLAAEIGGATGLIVTKSTQTNPAAETRWECTPLYSDDDERLVAGLQNWALVKNKQGVLGEWKVRWDDETHRFSVV